jgi:uncharacterized protein YecE (DUF72 family)
VLVDSDSEIAEFLEVMDILGEKLGPIIFQFPFFSCSIFSDRHAFTDRLVSFLKKLPANHKFGIEIRNRLWLDAEFAKSLMGSSDRARAARSILDADSGRTGF